MKVSISKNIDDLKNIPRDLTAGVSYIVVGLDDENFRVIDDRLEPILYPKHLFDIDDPTIPLDWIERRFDDEEYHIAPPEFSKGGFYEDYFDSCPQAVKIYERYLTLNGLKDYIKTRKSN